MSEGRVAMHSIWLHGSNVDCYTTVCEQLKSSGVFTVELVACGKRLAAGARRHKPFVSKILPEHLLGRGLAPIGTEPVLRTYAGTKPIGANLDPSKKVFLCFLLL